MKKEIIDTGHDKLQHLIDEGTLAGGTRIYINTSGGVDNYIVSQGGLRPFGTCSIPQPASNVIGENTKWSTYPLSL